MHVGVVFSQATAARTLTPSGGGRSPPTPPLSRLGADACKPFPTPPYTEELRRVARAADGWMPLIAPGLDKYTVADRVQRLRRMCDGNGRDPATMPVWGRCYIDDSDSWKPKAEVAAELGFSHFSVGVDRFAFPPMSHEEHLARVLAVVDDVRAIVA